MARRSSSLRAQMAAKWRVKKNVANNIKTDMPMLPLEVSHHSPSTRLREMATATVNGSCAAVR